MTLQIERCDDYYIDQHGERFGEVYQIAVREQKAKSDRLGMVITSLVIGAIFAVLLYLGMR